MSLRFIWIAGITLATLQLASATSLFQVIGNSASAGGTGFVDGTQVTSGTFSTTDGGNPAPFNGTSCGADASANCSTSWTFSSYGPIPVGESIISATLQLGIGDLDTHATGNQIASFVVGGVDLTSAINTAAEGSDPCVGTGNGCFNNIYRILSVTLPSSAFAQLALGTAGVTFSTQGPGWGVLGVTSSNGVFLDFASLSVTTAAGASVPEPGTLFSVMGGMLALAGYGFGRPRVSRNIPCKDKRDPALPRS